MCKPVHELRMLWMQADVWITGPAHQVLLCVSGVGVSVQAQ